MSSSPELCDHRSCGARALVVFVRGYLELTFCQHHARELKNGLAADDWECIDTPSGALNLQSEGQP